MFIQQQHQYDNIFCSNLVLQTASPVLAWLIRLQTHGAKYVTLPTACPDRPNDPMIQKCHVTVAGHRAPSSMSHGPNDIGTT